MSMGFYYVCIIDLHNRIFTQAFSQMQCDINWVGFYTTLTYSFILQVLYVMKEVLQIGWNINILFFLSLQVKSTSAEQPVLLKAKTSGHTKGWACFSQYHFQLQGSCCFVLLFLIRASLFWKLAEIQNTKPIAGFMLGQLWDLRV